MLSSDKLKKALENNEFIDFILGKGDYLIPDRDKYPGTDKESVLFEIYNYYKSNPNSSIDKLLESTLLNFLNGNEYEIMTSFMYFGRHFMSETSGVSPFIFDNNSYKTLQDTIEKNATRLQNYKELEEFGSYLNGGAYEYAKIVGQSLDEKYRAKTL